MTKPKTTTKVVASKLNETDMKVLNVLNADINMEYPVEYILEKLKVKPGTVYNSIHKLRKAYSINAVKDPTDRRFTYYSINN